jgi:tetratricopeptide (TPR) repeat protein
VTAYETGLAPYNRAKILVPFAPQPFIQDSMLKRKLFEMNGSAVRGQEALAAADRAVALGGSLMEASAIRSEVLVALGDTSGAVSELERFLRLSPGSVEARRRLTELLERSGNIARAEDSARAAVSMMPGEPTWQIALGDILFRQQKYGAAGDAYKRADILSPDPVLFFREVNSRIRAKDYRGVIDASRRRADLVRTNSTAKTYVGIALIGGDERTEGIKTLRETYMEARTAFEGGNVTLLGQWYEAVELLYQPTELAAAESALIEFSKGIGDGSLDPLGRGFLATLSMGSSAGPSKAVEYLAPLATVDFSKNAEIGAMLLDKLGTMQYASNDCAAAVKTFETALALAPNTGTILNNYAYLCGECLKDAKKGLPSARLAVQLNPERSEYLDTLGTLLYADNQLPEALETLKRAVLLANGAPVHYHLGQVYKAMGRLPEARASAEEALKLKPDPQTKQGIDQLLTELK